MGVLSIAFGMACIFGAAVVRGYAGFGFSLLSVTALSLFLEPRQIVPAIFILEVVASTHLLVSAWKDVHWQSLRWLAAGSLVGTPAGVYLLERVPAAPLTLGLAAVVVVVSVLLARGFTLKSMPGPVATAGTGITSGVLNGSIGIGGPPVVMFFFGSPAGVAAGRASMIAYFLFTDLLGLAWQWHGGLLDRRACVRALLYAAPLVAGVWLGNRAFGTLDQALFRRWVLRLLMALAVLTGTRALLQLA
ncbi:MAG TPA: sulfite exporter TauE/SafE family protein [Steroidobacteraceae bacterium]|nr:sulfite exporter TauE/SafE family protein [Steroidobacteraceae bacterium]